MKRVLVAIIAVAGLVGFSTEVWAGSGTVLKKGNQTVVVYQSASNPSQHWVERNNFRSKKSGSARAAVQKYLSRGYKKAGTKSW